MPGVTLRAHPPFAWAPLLEFLSDRAIPGVEDVGESHYRRTTMVDRQGAVVEVRPEGSCAVHVSMRSRSGYMDPEPVIGRVRHLFDLDARPRVIRSALSADPELRAIVSRSPGLRVPGAWDPFEIGVRAILGQQVSVKGASTLSGRFAKRFGRPLAKVLRTEKLDVLFPYPRVCIGAEAIPEIGGVGLPRARAASIVGFAEALVRGRVSFDPDIDNRAFLGALTAIKGIGPWTAHYVAMRARHDGDAFPAGDLVLLRALADASTPRALEVRAEAWRPWRAYAAMHLWRDYGRTRGGGG